MPKSAEKVRVLIIDDHALFRESVARLLQEEHDLNVRHCGSVREGLAMIAEWPAEVILLDFDLGDEKGSSLLAKLRDTGFAGKILLLTAGVNELEAADLIRRGIAGIVQKHSSPAELSESIRVALSGKAWFEPEYLKKIIEKTTASDIRRPAQRLFSERERQVLSFVFGGLANKEIADRLEVS